MSDGENSQEPEESTGNEVQDAYKLFMHLQLTARDHGSRVPFLAELEMRTLSFACSELEAIQRAASEQAMDHRSWIMVQSKVDLADFLHAIVVYFEKHGH